MYQPQIEFSRYGPYEVHLGHYFGLPAICLGDDNEKGAMGFRAVVTSRVEFQGRVKATQLVNRWWSRLVLGQITQTGGTGGSFWLDADPYPDTLVDVIQMPGSTHPPAAASTLSDRPCLTIQNSSLASINDQFKTYYMFRPYGDDNIWVTLGRVEWNWFGNALLTGIDSWSIDSWTLTSSGVTGPDFAKTTEFPYWEEAY